MEKFDQLPAFIAVNNIYSHKDRDNGQFEKS